MASNARKNDNSRPNQLRIYHRRCTELDDRSSYKLNIGSIRPDNYTSLYLSLHRFRFDYRSQDHMFNKSLLQLAVLDKIFESTGKSFKFSFEFFAFVKSYEINVYAVEIDIIKLTELYALPYAVVALVNDTLLRIQNPDVQPGEPVSWRGGQGRSLLGFNWETKTFVWTSRAAIQPTIYCVPNQVPGLPDWIVSHFQTKVTLKSSTDYRVYLHIDDDVFTLDEAYEQTCGISFGVEIGKCGCRILRVPDMTYIETRTTEFKNDWFLGDLTEGKPADFQERHYNTEVLVPLSERILPLYVDLLQTAQSQANLLARNFLFGDSTAFDDVIWLNRQPVNSFSRLNNIPIWKFTSLGTEPQMGSIAQTVVKNTYEYAHNVSFPPLPVATDGLTIYRTELATKNGANAYPTPNLEILGVNYPCASYQPKDVSAADMSPELQFLHDPLLVQTTTATIGIRNLFAALQIPVRETAPMNVSMSQFSKLIDMSVLNDLYKSPTTLNISTLSMTVLSMLQSHLAVPRDVFTAQPNIVQTSSMIASKTLQRTEEARKAFSWIHDRHSNVYSPSIDPISLLQVDIYTDYEVASTSYCNIHGVGYHNSPTPNWPRGRNYIMPQNQYTVDNFNPGNNPRYYNAVVPWSADDIWNVVASYCLYKPITSIHTLLEANIDGANVPINQVFLHIGGINNTRLLVHDCYGNAGSRGRECLGNIDTWYRGITLDYGYTPSLAHEPVEYATNPGLLQPRNGTERQELLIQGLHYSMGSGETNPWMKHCKVSITPGSGSQHLTTRNTLRLVNRLLSPTPPLVDDWPTPGYVCSILTPTNEISIINCLQNHPPAAGENTLRPPMPYTLYNDYNAAPGIPANLPLEYDFYSRMFNTVIETTPTSLIPANTVAGPLWEPQLGTHSAFWTERVLNNMAPTATRFVENAIDEATQFYKKDPGSIDYGKRYSTTMGNAYFEVPYLEWEPTQATDDYTFVYIWAADAPYNVPGCTISNVDAANLPYDRPIPDIRCAKPLASCMQPGADLAVEIAQFNPTGLTVQNFTDGAGRYEVHDYTVHTASPISNAPNCMGQMSAAYDRVSARVVPVAGATTVVNLLSTSTCGPYSNGFVYRAYPDNFEDTNGVGFMEREVGTVPFNVTTFTASDWDFKIHVNAFGESTRSVRISSDDNNPISHYPADIQIESQAADCLGAFPARITSFMSPDIKKSWWQDFYWASKQKTSPNIIAAPYDPETADPLADQYQLLIEPTRYSIHRGLMPQLLIMNTADMTDHYTTTQFPANSLMVYDKVKQYLEMVIQPDNDEPGQIDELVIYVCCAQCYGIGSLEHIIGTLKLQLTSKVADVPPGQIGNIDPIIVALLQTRIWTSRPFDDQIVHAEYIPMTRNVDVSGEINELDIWFEYENGKRLTHEEIINFHIDGIITALPVAELGGAHTYGRNTNVDYSLPMVATYFN